MLGNITASSGKRSTRGKKKKKSRGAVASTGGQGGVATGVTDDNAHGVLGESLGNAAVMSHVGDGRDSEGESCSEAVKEDVEPGGMKRNGAGEVVGSSSEGEGETDDEAGSHPSSESETVSCEDPAEGRLGAAGAEGDSGDADVEAEDRPVIDESIEDRTMPVEATGSSSVYGDEGPWSIVARPARRKKVAASAHPASPGVDKETSRGTVADAGGEQAQGPGTTKGRRTMSSWQLSGRTRVNYGVGGRGGGGARHVGVAGGRGALADRSDRGVKAAVVHSALHHQHRSVRRGGGSSPPDAAVEGVEGASQGEAVEPRARAGASTSSPSTSVSASSSRVGHGPGALAIAGSGSGYLSSVTSSGEVSGMPPGAEVEDAASDVSEVSVPLAGEGEGGDAGGEGHEGEEARARVPPRRQLNANADVWTPKHLETGSSGPVVLAPPPSVQVVSHPSQQMLLQPQMQPQMQSQMHMQGAPVGGPGVPSPGLQQQAPYPMPTGAGPAFCVPLHGPPPPPPPPPHMPQQPHQHQHQHQLQSHPQPGSWGHQPPVNMVGVGMNTGGGAPPPIAAGSVGVGGGAFAMPPAPGPDIGPPPPLLPYPLHHPPAGNVAVPAPLSSEGMLPSASQAGTTGGDGSCGGGVAVPHGVTSASSGSVATEEGAASYGVAPPGAIYEAQAMLDSCPQVGAVDIMVVVLVLLVWLTTVGGGLWRCWCGSGGPSGGTDLVMCRCLIWCCLCSQAAAVALRLEHLVWGVEEMRAGLSMGQLDTLKAVLLDQVARVDEAKVRETFASHSHGLEWHTGRVSCASPAVVSGAPRRLSWAP